MRRRAKVDANQSEIVKALRLAGASVRVLSHVGEGFPDLCIGWAVGPCRYSALLEVKDGTLPPSKKKLTPDEKDFHDSWKGPLFVVESAEEALRIIR